MPSCLPSCLLPCSPAHRGHAHECVRRCGSLHPTEARVPRRARHHHHKLAQGPEVSACSSSRLYHVCCPRRLTTLLLHLCSHTRHLSARVLDIVSARGGKAGPLEYVRQRWGFAPESTVAAGDAGNDILMLSGERLHEVTFSFESAGCMALWH